MTDIIAKTARSFFGLPTNLPCSANTAPWCTSSGCTSALPRELPAVPVHDPRDLSHVLGNCQCHDRTLNVASGFSNLARLLDSKSETSDGRWPVIARGRRAPSLSLALFESGQ